MSEEWLVSIDHDQLKSLPDSKILVLDKLKAFADDIFNVAQITVSVSEKEENTVGKRRKF